jgi:hypothetical protein
MAANPSYRPSHPSVGTAKDPVFEFVGRSRRAYLWVGDGDSCLFTLTTTEARHLRDFLNAQFDGEAVSS